MAAYFVPEDEVPASPPALDLAVLYDEQGRLQWVPELVLGLELSVDGAESPAFQAAIASRVRRLQARVHPDRHSGDGQLSR